MKSIIILLLFVFVIGCNGQNNTSYQMKITDIKTKQEPGNITPQLITNNNKIILDFKEKDYNIYLRSANCQFEILVDDVPPFRGFLGEITKKGTGFNGAIPINSCLLKSGKHIITTKIYPRYGQAKLEYMSGFEMEVYYRKAATIDEEFEMKLFNQETPSKSSNSTGLKDLPYFEMKAEFVADLPFEIEGWQNSINLKEEQENGHDLKKELQKKYQILWDIINKKDVNALRQIITERENLLAKAFYLTAEENENEIKDLLDIIENSNYKLLPFPKKAKIYFYGYDKITTLLTLEREGIIKFASIQDPKEIISLEFRFHRKKKGEELKVI